MNRSEGVSLAELLVILAILAIMATVGIPNLLRARADLDLKGAVRSTASLLSSAKTTSFRRKPGVTVAFSSHLIISCLDDEKDASCSGDKILESFSLPGEIILNQTFEDSAVFFENGLPKNSLGSFASGTITLRHQNTNTCYRITLSRSGRVKIWPKNDGC